MIMQEESLKTSEKCGDLVKLNLEELINFSKVNKEGPCWILSFQINGRKR